MARSSTAKPTLLNKVISCSGCSAQPPADEIGEVAGNPVPRPRPFLDGQMQVACLGLGGRGVVDGDGGSCDQISG